MEELQAGLRSATEGSGSSSIKNTLQSKISIKDNSVLGHASSKGPISLFKEMNRAAFGGKRKTDLEEEVSSESPSVLMKSRGKQPKSSVFDSTSEAAPPSALMRTAPKLREKIKVNSHEGQHQSNLFNKEDDKGKVEQIEDTGDSPVILAVKAIGIATALVGTGAFLAWEIARRALGVQNVSDVFHCGYSIPAFADYHRKQSKVDELVDRLANVIPARSKDPHALAGVGDVARTSLRARTEDEEWEDEETRLVSASQNEPMTLDQALDALDEAARKGEAAKWVSILSRQLNAERDQDLKERRQRVRAKQESLMQEQMSV